MRVNNYCIICYNLLIFLVEETKTEKDEINTKIITSENQELTKDDDELKINLISADLDKILSS